MEVTVKSNPKATFKDILSQPLDTCMWSRDKMCRFMLPNGCAIKARDGVGRADCLVSLVRPQHENYAGRRKYIHSHVKSIHPHDCEVIAQRVKSSRVRAVYALMGITA